MQRLETISTDLQKPIRLQELSTDLFLNDEKGNTINVIVTDGGSEYSITGNVVCYMIRPDTTTITIEGTASGNVASVTLPKTAYYYSGRASFVVKAESTENAVTLAAFTAIIYRDRSDRITDDERIIPSLSEIMAIVDQINNMTVSSSTLPAGANATAVLTSVNGHYSIAFGIPRGINGAEPDITEVTLEASEWSDDELPEQTVTVNGISEASHILVSISNEVTATQYVQAALGRILCTASDVDELTFTVYGSTPDVDIPIIVMNLSESQDSTEFTTEEIEEILDYVFDE